MKKKDFILIGGVLLTAVILFAVYSLMPRQPSASLKITVAGEVYGIYTLGGNQTIKINDTNECRIKDGVVTMTAADCPDHLCQKQKAIDSRGGTIVCLPNRVVLEIVSENTDTLDAVT